MDVAQVASLFVVLFQLVSVGFAVAPVGVVVHEVGSKLSLLILGLGLEPLVVGLDLQESGELYAVPTEVRHTAHGALKAPAAQTMLEVGQEESLGTAVLVVGDSLCVVFARKRVTHEAVVLVILGILVAARQ